jgi:hypothetical protein
MEFVHLTLKWNAKYFITLLYLNKFRFREKTVIVSTENMSV